MALKYPVSTLKTVHDCRSVLARLLSKGMIDDYRAVFRRMCEIAGQTMDDPADPMVKDFYGTLAGYEQRLTEKRGRNQPAHRVWQMLKRGKEIRQILIDWTMGPPTDGFKDLIDDDLSELTGEWIVLVYADRFEPKVVARAKERLLEYGGRLPTENRGGGSPPL